MNGYVPNDIKFQCKLFKNNPKLFYNLTVKVKFLMEYQAFLKDYHYHMAQKTNFSMEFECTKLGVNQVLYIAACSFLNGYRYCIHHYIISTHVGGTVYTIERSSNSQLTWPLFGNHFWTP